jgi:hypothetical protein
MNFQPSELDNIIGPEVNQNTQSYYVIQEYIKRVPVKTIIEIGASSGGGTTESLINGIQKSGRKTKLASLEVSKPRFDNLKKRYQHLDWFTPYNKSSLPISFFPSERDVATFILDTKVHGGNVPEVIRWLRQDIRYLKEHNIEDDGIAAIKKDFNVSSFDIACIDGSEFLGNVEFEALPNCDAYILDDIHVYKCWYAHRKLLNDPNYVLLFEEKNRGGTSLFTKKEIAEKYFKN